ncbi:MAG TPA: protein-methionine-sulfoxide reductase heme-binding subunit MsrQ [Steroidobacter sp.]
MTSRRSSVFLPATGRLRRVVKPLLFVLCLLPLASIVWRAFELTGTSLGANPIEKIQDTFGQWGLRLLLVTLAITPLRDWFSAPWLVSLRRMLGLYAFFYVLLHFLTWLLLDQGLYWPGIVEDIGVRPFITIGFLALLLLIPLAVTSTNGMMRRLGKRWKTLHRLVYVIVLLGVWHYYWQVKADVREPLVYLAIAVVLLGWRVWKAPRRRALQAPATSTSGSSTAPERT